MAKGITIQKKEPGRFHALMLLMRAWFGKKSMKKEENYFLIY
jgi:hypothetical protein